MIIQIILSSNNIQQFKHSQTTIFKLIFWKLEHQTQNKKVLFIVFFVLSQKI